MKIPRGLEDDAIWIKYYEMFEKYLELQELERHEYLHQESFQNGV